MDFLHRQWCIEIKFRKETSQMKKLISLMLAL